MSIFDSPFFDALKRDAGCVIERRDVAVACASGRSRVSADVFTSVSMSSDCTDASLPLVSDNIFCMHDDLLFDFACCVSPRPTVTKPPSRLPAASSQHLRDGPQRHDGQACT